MEQKKKQIYESNLSIYTYPEDDTDFPKQFLTGLMKQPIIPQEIIVKIMDISKDATIKDKSVLVEGMSNYFDKTLFNLSWLINASHDIKSFDSEKAKEIVKFLSNQLKEKKCPKPKCVSLDIEPIYNVKTGLNLMPFHANLIKGINSLKIPVSVYVNPSAYSNPKAKIANQEGHQDFIDALLSFPDNIVYLPAYLVEKVEDSVREDRILSSAKSFEKFNIKYRLIVDFEYKAQFEERMKFISDNNLLKHGLAIYRLNRKFLEPPSEVMAIIKDFMS